MPFPFNSATGQRALSASGVSGTVMLLGLVKAKCPKPRYELEHKVLDLKSNDSGVVLEDKCSREDGAKERQSTDYWSPSA